MFKLFRKENKRVLPITFHPITVKIKKEANLYVGQFLKIEPVTIENDDIIDDVNYYFSNFEDGIISNKISKKEEEYCEKYDYGIIRNILEDSIEVLVICKAGYLQRFNIELQGNYKNGDAFIINNGNIIDNNKVIGKITDSRYDMNNIIYLNCYENNKLVVFIQK